VTLSTEGRRPADIEALERSIVESVAPDRMLEIGGWLAPLDAGPIGRAKSAVPLSHHADAGAITKIEAAYLEAGLPPAFRLAETPGLTAARDELQRLGYAPHKPTILKFGAPEGLMALSDAPAELMKTPDSAWTTCFSGEGFDPGEAAGRVRNLARSPDVLLAAVREDGRIAAVGVVTFGRGWAGVHGMRTAPDARRRGHASRVLSALGHAAAERGVSRVVLQVVEDNPARRLYRAAGFTYGWRYHYWERR
jgi:GNAT superfamily N-acetyltransferase